MLSSFRETSDFCVIGIYETLLAKQIDVLPDGIVAHVYCTTNRTVAWPALIRHTVLAEHEI